MTIKTWEDRDYEAKCAELEIAQGTLKNLWARVEELEAELEKARLHIKHIGNDALRAENAELRAKLAAVRTQQPIGAVGDMESGRAIRWYDYHTKLPAGTLIYLAAGAQPVPEAKTIATAPECLNTNDKAFWVTGWNECRKAMLAAAKELK